MLVRLNAYNYSFTASGDHGQVSVYDDTGRRLVSGLRDAEAARAWVDREALRKPKREPVAPREPLPAVRNRVTGY